MITTSQTPLFPALSAQYSIKVSGARNWLKLGLLALILSGIAPLVLLAGRASIYADKAMILQWFTPVLVIHVNLSVGLWFLAMAMVLWRILWPIKFPPVWQGASTISFLLGICAMVGAPFAGGEAFTSNYIPVQNNALFFLGLSLILCALLLMILPYLWQLLTQKLELKAMLIGMNMLTVLAALSCFAFSVMQHPTGYSGEGYYEAIWWAGGHVLQFMYVQLALLGWMIMAEKLALPALPGKILLVIFALLTLTAISSPLIFWFVDVNSYYHIKFFSWQMNVVTGTVPGLAALWFGYQILRHRISTASFWVMASSLTLFLSGGLVGFLIEGSSTTIPAHYHGSTVGVTLALMGIAYLVLPLIGKADVQQWKMAKWQPVLYGSGQLLHVIGFAIAGSQGVGRKVAGNMEGANEIAQMGMQLVRFGGILAVIGGGLFVVVMIRAWRRSSNFATA